MAYYTIVARKNAEFGQDASITFTNKQLALEATRRLDRMRIKWSLYKDETSSGLVINGANLIIDSSLYKQSK